MWHKFALFSLRDKIGYIFGDLDNGLLGLVYYLFIYFVLGISGTIVVFIFNLCTNIGQFLI